MSKAQKIIGQRIRALREQRGLTLESLAAAADISYQYLSGVETGKENFSIGVLEGLARSLGVTLRSLVAAAYEDSESEAGAPTVNRKHFRAGVPLPAGLTIAHVEAALNAAQSIIHRINRNLHEEVGQPLQSLIQGNNFSGLVSNILTNALDQHTPYKHNHVQRYPDLINKKANRQRGVGLEVKTTINVGKGGESHNGHGGWHLIACYRFLPSGDVAFSHVMFGILNGHQDAKPDWSYVGSKVNEQTSSRRTETYTTTLGGTTKLRDGAVYLDPDVINFSRWHQSREGVPPSWSIFAPL